MGWVILITKTLRTYLEREIMTDTNMMHQWPEVLSHLVRGGTWGYYWRAQGKLSYWWPTRAPLALPPDVALHDWYFSVHPSEVNRGPKRRSTRKTVAAVNCLFAEFDAKDYGGQLSGAIEHVNLLAPSPTVVVCSGGGYHAYWLLQRPFVIGNDEDRDYIEALQKAWVDYTGGDPNAKDLTRVLRVPGTVNHKPDYGPDFPAVRLVRVDWDRLYALLELERALPHAEPEYRPSPTIWDRAERPPASRDGKVAWAEALLSQLHPSHADNYDEWVQVGMSLRELGPAGLALWDRWSCQSPKYEPGLCKRKWRSFGVGRVTLGTLNHLAKQHTAGRRG